MSRREFTDKVKAAIVHRAMNADGRIVCEGCGLVLGKKPYRIDHIIPDALVLDKRRELTAEEGQLLGVACCDSVKTPKDISNIAKAKRRELAHLGIRRSANPVPGSKGTRFKKHMDGRVSWR